MGFEKAINLEFESIDLNDIEALERTFEMNKPVTAVLHFAFLNESEDPLAFYQNNIGGTLSLLKTMQKFNCKQIILESSSDIYGNTSSAKETE